MPQDDLIARLAQQIDAAKKKAAPFFVSAEDVAALRRRGACELHSICEEFVGSVNRKLTHATLDLSPHAYAPEMFRASGANIFQIGSEGRQLQIAFEATAQLVSTEKFLIPHVLEGEVRTYNQEMLQRFEIRSQLLFFCVEDEKAAWRFFDWRTRQTGPVGAELLATLMGRLF
jgi:hypothetical protein